MEKGVAPSSDLFIYLNSLKLEATLGRYTIIASQANKFDGLSRIYEQMVQYIAVSLYLYLLYLYICPKFNDIFKLNDFCCHS